MTTYTRLKGDEPSSQLMAGVPATPYEVSMANPEASLKRWQQPEAGDGILALQQRPLCGSWKHLLMTADVCVLAAAGNGSGAA